MSGRHKAAGLSLTAMLVLLSFVGPFALQIFLPSMPGLIKVFETDHAGYVTPNICDVDTGSMMAPLQGCGPNTWSM